MTEQLVMEQPVPEQVMIMKTTAFSEGTGYIGATPEKNKQLVREKNDRRTSNEKTSEKPTCDRIASDICKDLR